MPQYNFQRESEKLKISVNSEGRIVRTHSIGGIVIPGGETTNLAIGQGIGYLPGQANAADSSATLRDIEVDRISSKGEHSQFHVDLTYSTDAPATNDDPDPCNQPTKRSQQNTEQTLYIIRDRNGDLIANAAGQAPAGGVPVAMLMPTWIYEWNERTYDRTRVTEWSNALNQNTWNGCAEFTLKLGLSATEMREGQFHYWAFRAEMPYFRLGWKPTYVNAGLLERCSLAQGLRRPILDPHTSQPVTEPWPLYEIGHASFGEAIPMGNLPADVNFITVDWFNVKNYSQLGPAIREF